MVLKTRGPFLLKTDSKRHRGGPHLEECSQLCRDRAVPRPPNLRVRGGQPNLVREPTGVNATASGDEIEIRAGAGLGRLRRRPRSGPVRGHRWESRPALPRRRIGRTRWRSRGYVSDSDRW